MEPNTGLTFRKEIYTEVVKDNIVVAAYKQNGHLTFFKTEELTAAGFDKIVGADLPPVKLSEQHQ
jgi:hypothetical protein